MVKFHINRWSPDTCKCNFEYQWDEDLPVGSRPILWKSNLNVCPEHSGQTGEPVYTSCLDQNQRKNITIDEIEKQFPDIIETFEDPFTGEPNLKRRKFGVTTDWFFTGKDDTRVLNIELRGRPQSIGEKTAMRARLNAKFGTGKVNFI